jgi:hypothetical protein
VVAALGGCGDVILIGMLFSGAMTVADAQDGRWARSAGFAVATMLPAVCVEVGRRTLRWRFPRFPRTTLVAAAGLAATVAFGVGSVAAGTAFQWQ